ncbi:hypothetical protein EG856_02270 [Mycoplasmopsis phocirhinis]|uniref:HNH endonuclease n=1 Tax=Mycoplasmopsis phocirhinis TaxID=142650 RepID=A0A4V0ZAH6_9BACT|nr:hypothetical protein [Mycoplasmopsis phocirhinis]QBF34732.1 hypothetical protein EG856_02270 [Mycoplasmopsis phocirhinis]
MLNRTKIWRNYFGNRFSGFDYCGREISINSPWTIEHINADINSNAYSNLIPAHYESNYNKANKSVWWDNDYELRVIKLKNSDYQYAIKRRKYDEENFEWVTPRNFR